MSNSRSCTFCGNEFQFSADRCPHCGEPGLFANVFAADNVSQHRALAERFRLAIEESTTRRAELVLQDFERAVNDSQAVIARGQHEMLRLATSDNEIYGTFYNLIGAGLRLPEGGKWDVLRGIVDSALFPNYKEQIRFAALSLDGVGLSNYGEYSITLRTEMIARRASVFDENSIMFMVHHDIKIADADNLPKGYRAIWSERARLAVAKISPKINASTESKEYSRLLLQQGATSEEDQFVEVHIWGPLTVRTIDRVTRTDSKSVPRATIKTIKIKLEKANVKVD